MEKVKVGIVGHTGRLGWPLLEMMQEHPNAEVIYTESRSLGVLGIQGECEVVFFALPHGSVVKCIRRFEEKKIIDLSLDHRNNPCWTYGLPEIFAAEICQSNRVSNPGCYATSILLALLPLKGKIKSARISSTSGISGAGLKPAYSDNFLVYKEGGKHPQMKEMTRLLETSSILFVPQRIDTADRGIVSTIFVEIEGSLENLSKLYAEAYEKCPFVRIKTEIETKNVIGTNFCDIKVMQFGKDVVVISALDNLIKGGAGQAVQNFNLMCGFSETTGLL